MQIMLRGCAVFIFLLSFLLVHAQTVPLAGKVVNEKNEPIPGASVKIAGASGGTITDMEGRYILHLLPGKTYGLVISAVGYTEKHIAGVEAAGGKVLMPKTEITTEYGYMALFLDTEGNRIGLHSSPQ